jgi:hypothetical protein
LNISVRLKSRDTHGRAIKPANAIKIAIIHLITTVTALEIRHRLCALAASRDTWRSSDASSPANRTNGRLRGYVLYNAQGLSLCICLATCGDFAMRQRCRFRHSVPGKKSARHRSLEPNAAVRGG